MKKRLLAVLICVCLAFGTCFTVVAEETLSDAVEITEESEQTDDTAYTEDNSELLRKKRRQKRERCLRRHLRMKKLL